MKPSHLIVPFTLCVLAFSCICGCTTTSTGGGIRDVTPPVTEEKTYLDTALSELEVLAGEGFENLTGMEVVMVSGTDVTTSGNASTWILGIRQDGRQALLVHSHGAWSRQNWNHTLEGEAISTDAIVMPHELYEMHADDIEALGPETDLILVNGTYAITSHATAPETLRFDAQTGEAI